jgi:hypothetical protein
MPKKKPRSVAFTFHMEGQDDRAVSVKLTETEVRGKLTLMCRLAGLEVFVHSGLLSDALFDIAKNVLKQDKKREKECAKAEKEAVKKFGKTVAAVGTNVA